jgi:hypothetical protein
MNATKSVWYVLGGVLLYGPLMLFIDAHVHAAWPGQYLLGILTFAVLYFCARSVQKSERGMVWLCAIVATGFEVLGSLIWGAYHYRYGGIPLFVPFGHALIYVFAFTLASSELVQRNEKLFTRIILGIAALWALGGVTFFAPLTGRQDSHGLLWLPLFAYVLTRSPRKAFFAALFIATTDIELFGTWFHSWMWAPTTPWIHVTSGNPPSAIAGGYAIIDGSIVQVAALLAKLREQGFYARRMFLRRISLATT